MQYLLARLGNLLDTRFGLQEMITKGNGQKFGEFSIKNLNVFHCPPSVSDTIALIVVLWLDNDENIIAGFEVEKSTSIYSGILRLSDLSLSFKSNDCHFYLVAPEKREKEIRAQLLRPSIRSLESQSISYLLFHDLRCDCDAMCRFGNDLSVLEKISKKV